MTDRDIIALLFARSEEGISALREKFGRLCRRIAMNILHDERDAEECTDDTWLAVWNTVPPKEPNPLSPYVGRIARNLALDRYRYSRAERRYAGGDALLSELSEVVSGTEGAEDAATAQELANAVSDFLRALRPAERRLFVRRYWYGDEVARAAADAGITPNSAAVRLHRMRERLRKYLLERGFTL